MWNLFQAKKPDRKASKNMNKPNIFITGASSGIGFAVAQTFAESGAQLFLTARDEKKLEQRASELRANYGGIVKTKAENLLKIEAVQNISSWLHSEAENLDAIVLNAGFYEEGSLSDFPTERMRINLEVNFFSNFLFAKELFDLIRSGNSKRIFIIGSTAAYEAYPLVPTYGVAKWALRGLAVNLREELKHQNIGVTFVSPGPTWTGMWEGETLPRDQLLEPGDVAAMILASFKLRPNAVVDEIIIRPMSGDMHS